MRAAFHAITLVFSLSTYATADVPPPDENYPLTLIYPKDVEHKADVPLMGPIVEPKTDVTPPRTHYYKPDQRVQRPAQCGQGLALTSSLIALGFWFRTRQRRSTKPAASPDAGR